MDTPNRLDEIMKTINMDEVREHLELGEEFTLAVTKDEAQAVLEACGLILNPKNNTYQSLEAGDRWKVDESSHDSVKVTPDPIVYDTTAVGTFNSPLGAGNKLNEEMSMLDGLVDGSDSPEGKVMDDPKSPIP